MSSLGKVPLDAIIRFLSSTNFLVKFSSADIKTLAKRLNVRILDGSEVLMNEGEVGDCLYLLMHGRLRAFINYDSSEQKTVGEIGIGETVGEMALLTNEQRSATVIAVRDCVLLELKKAAFDELTLSHPSIGMEVARRCIKRLSIQQKAKNQNKSQVAKAIALVPMSDNPELLDFLPQLIGELKKHASLLYLTSAFVSSALSLDFSASDFLEKHKPRLIGWLNEQENKYDFIFYQANSITDHWTNTCLTQVDATFLVGFSDDYSFLKKSYENFLPRHKAIQRQTSLVLLHRSKNQLPINTQVWLTKLNVDNFYHIVFNDMKHIQRLVRIICGKSVGLVLGGGGARAFAHIGLIKCLEEHNIPIDFVAGTSMGAVVAAGAAYEYDSATMQHIVKEFTTEESLTRLTYPYLAVSSDTYLVKAIKKRLGMGNIEDLWLRNFCISTNLTKNEIVVHQNGILWQAIRASVAVPALYPPVVINDDVLVDGGLLNNLPVDVMRQLCNPGKVIASIIATEKNRFGFTSEKNIPSIFQLLHNYFSPFQKTKRFSYLGDILVASMLSHGEGYQHMMEKSADVSIPLNISAFSLLDFTSSDAIIEVGYNDAKKQLENFSLG